MKKFQKLTTLFAALALVFALGSCANGANQNPPTPESYGALSSLKAVEGADHVYSVEYNGDYLLDDLIAANLKTENELISYLYQNIPSWKLAKENGIPLTINVNGAGCSSITANNAGEAGGKIFGRNFDYPDGSALIIHTKPYEGYESVSTSYPYYVTGNLWWEPTDKIATDAICLGLIYAPLDGMNEKGLYISILQLDDEQTNQTAEGKNDVQTTVAVRYLLDNAASVEEAITILEGFNMHNVFGTAYHFAIADNTGKSVVVEYLNNEMIVTETRVVTNHYISPNSEKIGSDNSYIRYSKAINAGEKANWNMTPAQIREVLKSVSAHQYASDPSSNHRTIWSAVYEPNIYKITYYFHENYETGVEVIFGNSN